MRTLALGYSLSSSNIPPNLGEPPSSTVVNVHQITFSIHPIQYYLVNLSPATNSLKDALNIRLWHISNDQNSVP